MLMAASSTPAKESRRLRAELNGLIPRNRRGFEYSVVFVFTDGGSNLRVYTGCVQGTSMAGPVPVGVDGATVAFTCPGDT